MTISESTRKSRVQRWENSKQAWEAKLATAENQNGTDVANKMIAEAEGMIKRLKETDGVKSVSGNAPKLAPKKTKQDTSTYRDVKENSTSTIGV